ncbi:TetR/AcrR family transcriptional regulator [Amycolatopsis jiangsuensis]|uniref:AcrR family transcriptional regulator n=1 Tax=Amycolatopsis jiangsuensis TaxID=1181879 RepID=A0A840IX27_9PSEU|nr:TetR/AcrR family transcriptional regulator [Amycolatopsis jiangsuensis]MBB4685762.1 AcrR family transcriptional regulator [Amycolatopsis jiangsuensis]
MGHRDNLLTAARECLLTTGYARTTVRDLVAASGANQASINYHFGSKEQLLTRALIDLNTEWGERLFSALGAPDEPVAQVDRWRRIIDSIRTHRDLWFLNFESVSYVQHDAEIRAINAHGQQLARTALAQAFGGLSPDAGQDEVRVVGAHYYSLLVGLAVQWLTDPDHAPDAADVVEADRRARRRD